MKLIEKELDILEDEPCPAPVEAFLEDAERTIQFFWDRWTDHPIEQYVASDFRYVWGAMQAWKRLQSQANETSTAPGTLGSFCEWGSGFGVITGLAWFTGLSAVGIEAEPFLHDQAKQLFARHSIQAELWQGNFLPSSAGRLANRQANHASLFHHVPPVYDEHDTDIDDFRLIFAYPWPGEEHFLREVFRNYANPKAEMIMFRGPYDLEFWSFESTR